MADKMQFAIQNMSMVEENSNSSFSLLKLDFFSSGYNLNNIYVSEDTLRKTADTIKNCPLVWKFDKFNNDVGNHDPEEVPCGFIPESFEISENKLDDDRIMLSVNAYVWKRYSGKLLSFFERDSEKPVSVEISVSDSQDLENGYTELLDYSYEAVTVLGSKITPAIPLAHATVLQFAKEYNDAYLREFSYKYKDIDFSIPAAVKSNAEHGLSLYGQHGRGGNSISLALARHLVNSEVASYEKVKRMYKAFSGKKFIDMDKDVPSDSYISFMLYGGIDGKEWSSKLGKEMEDADKVHLKYFEEGTDMPYKKIEDMNPALKGIKPPISLEQANAIAEQADAIGVTEEKNGWAIAISNFKKTHKVVDGRWVKKDTEKESFADEEEIEKDGELELNTKEKEEDSEVKNKDANDKFSLNSSQILEILGNALSEYRYGENSYRKYWVYSFDDSFAYFRDCELDKMFRSKYSISEGVGKVMLDDKEEVIQAGLKTPGEVAKMSLNANIDVPAILEMLNDETEKYREIAESEFSKENEEEVNFGAVISAMFGKMCKMAESLKAYMEENKSLKEFKESIEKEKFSVAVNKIIKDLTDIVNIPQSVIDEMRESSKNFNADTIGVWENDCKAKAFSFAVKEKDGTNAKKMKVAFPFADEERKKSVWEELGK